MERKKENFIEFRNVAKYYNGIKALDGLSLNIKRGDIVYDSSGKRPYVSLKTMISLCMGAIRQGDDKIEDLIKRIEA